MEILSYILADTVSRPPRPYNGYVQWNQKPSYLLCFTEKYLYFNTVINSLIIIKTLTCKIPPDLPCLPAGRLCQREELPPVGKEGRPACAKPRLAGRRQGGDFSIQPLGYGEMKAGDS